MSKSLNKGATDSVIDGAVDLKDMIVWPSLINWLIFILIIVLVAHFAVLTICATVSEYEKLIPLFDYLAKGGLKIAHSFPGYVTLGITWIPLSLLVVFTGYYRLISMNKSRGGHE